MRVYFKTLKQEDCKKLLAQMVTLHNGIFVNSQWKEKSFEIFFLEKERAPVCIAMFMKKILRGFALGRKEKNSNVFVFEILVVDYGFRRGGIGNKLVKRFLKEVQKKEAVKVKVHFRKINDLKNFYLKFGFKDFKICGKYMNGEDKCEMILDMAV